MQKTACSVQANCSASNKLCEYKNRGLVRTALRRRVFAEMYQMLKKGG